MAAKAKGKKLTEAWKRRTPAQWAEVLKSLREKQIGNPFFDRSARKPKAKGKRPSEPKYGTPQHPLYALTQAIREYERVSYYLATQGDFDFIMDDEAQGYFDSSDPMNAAEIMALVALRKETFGRPIPKGNYIEGLAARTDERQRRNKLAKKGGRK